ncbi:hypothetical protein WR25_10467 [Diploscapter pachys]|uniref:Uncharacterized protein n=1 Tax=Diploscapter pachys TaxID=2018661 RepID=A0A2A2JAW6_9BILA|nr:hypothetical protein WR25_10467 [Diploscapter pachys]
MHRKGSRDAEKSPPSTVLLLLLLLLLLSSAVPAVSSTTTTTYQVNYDEQEDQINDELNLKLCDLTFAPGSIAVYAILIFMILVL